MGWQHAAQLLQAVDHLVGVHVDAATQRHHIHLVRLRRQDNVAQRRLNAQRHAAAALDGHDALGHQQAHGMGLLGKGGEQHLGGAVQALLGHAANGMANDGGDRLGVEVLLKHLERAAQPGFPHHHIQRGHHYGDKPRQPQGDGGLAEGPTQVLGPVFFDHLHEVAQIDLSLALVRLSHPVHALARHALAQALQLFNRQSHDAPGAVALVEQSFDDAQFFYI